MTKMRNYRFGFDIWGLLLFLGVMVPNMVWFFVPAPNDVLRQESLTSVIDTFASVFQVLMLAALCAVQNDARSTPMRRGWKISVAVLLVLYLATWVVYYAGMANAVVILLLTAAPCAAFLLFAIARSNLLALSAAVAFTICHLLHAVINFL